MALILSLITSAGGANDNLAKASDETKPEVFIDTQRWDVALAPSTLLRVTNQLGDIRARSASSDELSVIGIIQRFRPDQDDAQIEIEPRGESLEISTHYPSALAEATKDGPAGRIDLTLLVPPGESLEIQTAAGLIELKGVPRNLKARSESGRIRISASTSVSASSDSGPLVVVLKQPGPERTARLTTLTGAMKVDFLEDPFPSLWAKSGGKIETVNVPGKVHPDPKNMAINVVQVGNSEEVVIQAESKSGNLDLRALPSRGLR